MANVTAPPPSNVTTTPPAPPPSNSTIAPPAPSPSNSTTAPPAPPPSNSTISPPAPPQSPPAAPPPKHTPEAPPPHPSPMTPPWIPPTSPAPPPANETTPSPPTPNPPVTPPPSNDTTPTEPPRQAPPHPPSPLSPPPPTPSPPGSPGNEPPAPPLSPHPPSPPSPSTWPAPPGHSSPPSPTGGQDHPSPPSPHAPPPASSWGSNPGLGTPVIVGIAIGGVAVAAVLALLLVFCLRKKKRRRDEEDAYYAPRPPPAPKNDNNAGQLYHWQQAAPSAADHFYAKPPEPSPFSPNVLKPPRRHMHQQMHPPPPPPHFNSSGGSSSSYSGSEIPLRPLQPGIAMGFSKSTFTYEELAIATNGFSVANLLGQGGFGYVHKGILPDGKEVAIKSLKDGSGQGEREFQAEVEIISRVHHKHLVSLVGYCMAGSQRMLVYEFVPNGTLEFHLHGKEQPPMDWATRVKIALGSAKGLAYLHEDCQPKIIHRDIKASNILLDFKFEAKVADFGLAKFTSDMNTHVSTRVMGTFGYLAPEYASSGKLTEKSDIFSFGVMLLELITGKHPVNSAHAYMEDSLIDWARPLLTRTLEDGNFDPLVDPNLKNQYNIDQMARIVACAAACVRHSARRRPRMSQVVRTLEGQDSLADLSDGLTPGHSTAFSFGSSDYDNIQYREDLKKHRKAILGSQEHGPSSEYSGQTSEYGLNPSASSSEGHHTHELKSGKFKNDSQGF